MNENLKNQIVVCITKHCVTIDFAIRINNFSSLPVRFGIQHIITFFGNIKYAAWTNEGWEYFLQLNNCSASQENFFLVSVLSLPRSNTEIFLKRDATTNLKLLIF